MHKKPENETHLRWGPFFVSMEGLEAVFVDLSSKFDQCEAPVGGIGPSTLVGVKAGGLAQAAGWQGHWQGQTLAPTISASRTPGLLQKNAPGEAEGRGAILTTAFLIFIPTVIRLSSLVCTINLSCQWPGLERLVLPGPTRRAPCFSDPAVVGVPSSDSQSPNVASTATAGIRPAA